MKYIGPHNDIHVSNIIIIIIIIVLTTGVMMEQPSAKIFGHFVQLSEPAAG